MTFESYATGHLAVMLRTAQTMTGDHYLAEDLVQDVLIKLASRWDTISQVDSIDAYVRRMLVNEFFSWRRKWSRIVPRADPTATPVPHDPQDDFAATLAERDSLVAAVSRLPPRQRVIIAMRYLADLPDTAIADTLGCSEVTVRVHASRALAALRISNQETHETCYEEDVRAPHRR